MCIYVINYGTAGTINAGFDRKMSNTTQHCCEWGCLLLKVAT